MHGELIKQLLHAAPFVPFTIHMADGQSYHVAHPDFAMLTQGARTLAVNTDGERVSLVNTNLISRIETTQAAQEV